MYLVCRKSRYSEKSWITVFTETEEQARTIRDTWAREGIETKCIRVIRYEEIEEGYVPPPTIVIPKSLK